MEEIKVRRILQKQKRRDFSSRQRKKEIKPK